MGEHRVVIGHDQGPRGQGQEGQREQDAKELQRAPVPGAGEPTAVPPTGATASRQKATSAQAKSRKLTSAIPAPRSRAVRRARGIWGAVSAPATADSRGRARTRSRAWFRVAGAASTKTVYRENAARPTWW